jgi:DNA-binding transcriptional LysR family regulator
LGSPTHLEDLRAFCLVVDLKSITAAAAHLGIPKGSVSRRLARLEREIGVPLIRRNPRMVQPTEFGLAYHGRVKHALDVLGDASAALQLAHEPSGSLRIACSPGFGVCVLAPLILPFTARYPDVTVDIHLADELPSFSTNRFDVAIYPSLREVHDSSLITRRLLDWTVKLVAAPSYIAKHGIPNSPEALIKHNFVLGSGPPRNMARTISAAPLPGGRSKKIDVPDAVVSSNTVFAREAAISGSGIALVPDFVVERDIAEGRLVQVLPRFRFQTKKGSMVLLYPASTLIPPKVRAFVDFLVQALPVHSKAINKRLR